MKEKRVSGSMRVINHPGSTRAPARACALTGSGLFIAHGLQGRRSLSIHIEGRGEQGCLSAIVALAKPTSHRRQYCANDAPHYIRSQIPPARLPAGQIYLVPLIQHGYKQCHDDRDSQPLPNLQSAGKANPAGEQGEKNAVDKLIPWRWYQIHSKRLCAQHEQAEDDPHHQQHGRDAQVMSLYPLQKQNEY